MGNTQVGLQCTGGVVQHQDHAESAEDRHLDTEVEPENQVDEQLEQAGPQPDFEMEAELVSSLQQSSIDPMAAYDVEISGETAAVKKYLALLNSLH